MLSLSGKKIWVAGHNGMVGRAMLRQLQNEDCTILTVDRQALDLRDQARVSTWMKAQRPDIIVLAAATVGGIEANRAHPADFLYDNMMIAANIIHAAYESQVQRLLYLGSSCIYPRHAAQPISEEALLTGPLEPTNEAYAIAKIAGIKLCQTYRAQYKVDFTSAMPCNLYGPWDRFDAVNSHVIPAMILKFIVARDRGDAQITLWGTGAPLREFLHVDDLARGIMTLLQNEQNDDIVNIGSGSEISIHDLAHIVARTTGYKGEIIFDPSMPDGTPRKIMDNTRITQLGWNAQITLDEGITDAVAWYRNSILSKVA